MLPATTTDDFLIGIKTAPAAGRRGLVTRISSKRLSRTEYTVPRGLPSMRAVFRTTNVPTPRESHSSDQGKSPKSGTEVLAWKSSAGAFISSDSMGDIQMLCFATSVPLIQGSSSESGVDTDVDVEAIGAKLGDAKGTGEEEREPLDRCGDVALAKKPERVGDRDRLANPGLGSPMTLISTKWLIVPYAVLLNPHIEGGRMKR